MGTGSDENQGALNQITFSNRQLLVLIMPLIIEQFLGVAVGMADSIMVASVGEAAVSAVSLVDSVNVLLFFAFNALATGGAVVCGQYIGRKDVEKGNEAAEQLLVFVTLLAAGIMAILYGVKYFILHGLFGQIEADVMAYANTYFLIVEASIPFMALYSAGAALFRVMGNSSMSMKISIVMNIVNVCGNAILIFGFHCGVEGVAIPTIVSRILGAVAVIMLLRNEKYLLHIRKPFRYRYNKKMVLNILRIGVPSGIESSLFNLGKIMLLSVVSLFGTASIAANAVSNNIATLQTLPAAAIGVGLITVVSQCSGARDFGHARYYTKKLILWAYGLMAIWNGFLFIIQPFFVDLYNVSDEAAHMAMIILWLHGGLGILLWPAAFTLPQALKGAGDTTFVMMIAVGSMWVFRIVTGVYMAKYLGFGVLGTWYAMFIDWVCRAALYLLRYRGKRWEEKYIK
ncbi:MAG: MATE family efflux transporter [Firmicutes bacterium]|nr:MATE family efflux transporter [Bacillota bacterium]